MGCHGGVDLKGGGLVEGKFEGKWSIQGYCGLWGGLGGRFGLWLLVGWSRVVVGLWW